MATIDKDFQKFYSNVGKAFGMDDLSLVAFATLYLENEPIAMEDLASKTGYSLASISNTMKLLERVGIAQRKKKPGSRKVFFTVEKNLAKMNIYKMDATVNALIKPGKLFLPELIKKHKNKENNKEDKEKVKNIENYYKQILMFEKMMNKWKTDLYKLAQDIEKIN